MTSVFTRIINGELPGRIVYSDEVSVAFLSIAPVRPGHTLVVPRLEVDHWIDLPDDVVRSVWSAAATVGRAIDTVFRPRRVAAMLAGLEVPHTHVHLFPIDSESQMSFSLADPDPDPAMMDDVAERLRAALAGKGAP
ncbi:HIT family hydrolase, diadenosine tetraphosphate hydrolase [Frankia sp. EI5c]|uniref:HIT family protein n=1 Tax=Frankia sp. EI5c TaxID=683316 RepID=UPI0007C3BAFC|nr:HIT family protein [Frankia sp. EI5c]OAA28290.1 HIT family hydrolase, diadenosine tetraphosphate hydrolase [Frankia sp. EI5c]